MSSTYLAPVPRKYNAYEMPNYTFASEDGLPKYNPINRTLVRTPSPTPSEQAELARTGLVDWQKYRSWNYWRQGGRIWYLILILILLVIVILSIIFHKAIVNWLQPFARWMHNLPAGFLIPIAIFFVISFPPLFGHEILAILVGLAWGLGPGFGIVAIGTLLGEWGNYYTFRYCCRARAEKMEKSNILYSALANVIREGGFKIVLVCRYSIVPGHLTTALFSTCGIGFFVFTLAAILSLPKQFVTVYLGYLLEQSNQGTQTSKSKAITAVLLIVTIIVSIFAMRYLRTKTAAAKEEIVYARRKARQLGPAESSIELEVTRM